MIEKALKTAVQKIVEEKQGAVVAAVVSALRGLVADELEKRGLTKEKLEYAFTWLVRELEKKMAKDAGEEVPEESAEEAAKPATAEPALSWCYGGFDGSKAEIAEDAVLASATLKGDTLSFSWEKGDCRNLGATSKEDAGHTLACLFLEDGAGGKFEWVSTSRKTRSVENIKDGYNGWPKTALDRGGRLWFCIAGSDGKRRTACVEVTR